MGILKYPDFIPAQDISEKWWLLRYCGPCWTGAVALCDDTVIIMSHFKFFLIFNFFRTPPTEDNGLCASCRQLRWTIFGCFEIWIFKVIVVNCELQFRIYQNLFLYRESRDADSSPAWFLIKISYRKSQTIYLHNVWETFH